MSCTKQEIERKRVAAIQKRQSKISNSLPQRNIPQSSNNFSPSKSNIFNPLPSSSSAGPNKPISLNQQRQFHPYQKPEVNSKADNSIVINAKVISGTVYLISEERFEVNPSEFCVPLINIFKTIPSRSYGNYSISFKLISKAQ